MGEEVEEAAAQGEVGEEVEEEYQLHTPLEYQRHFH